jgi:hypothetical protein
MVMGICVPSIAPMQLCILKNKKRGMFRNRSGQVWKSDGDICIVVHLKIIKAKSEGST